MVAGEGFEHGVDCFCDKHKCRELVLGGLVHRMVGCGHTHLSSLTRDTNNNNAPFSFETMRLRREEPPPRFGKLNHALAPGKWPNPNPAIPPSVVRTPHLHGAPPTEETSFVKLVN